MSHAESGSSIRLQADRRRSASAAEQAVVVASSGGESTTLLQDYLQLTRMRLNVLVLITTAVGFALAAAGRTGMDLGAWMVLVHALIGTALCGSGGSVLNQWIERDSDRRMRRTADRPLPAGRMSPEEALWMGAVLSVLGVMHLALLVNWIAALLAFVTIILYALVYTPMKYKHWTCTIVGAVPGAIPPVIGWGAASGDALAPGAWFLFAILFCWQMPHFFAIGWMYRDEYKRAGSAILPAVDAEDMHWTSHSIFAWSTLLSLAVLAPALAGAAGLAYFLFALVLSITQFILAERLRRQRTRATARTFFLWSIAYLPAVLGALLIDATLL